MTKPVGGTPWCQTVAVPFPASSGLPVLDPVVSDSAVCVFRLLHLMPGNCYTGFLARHTVSLQGKLMLLD